MTTKTTAQLKVGDLVRSDSGAYCEVIATRRSAPRARTFRVELKNKLGLTYCTFHSDEKFEVKDQTTMQAYGLRVKWTVDGTTPSFVDYRGKDHREHTIKMVASLLADGITEINISFLFSQEVN